MVERFEFTCPDCDPDIHNVNLGRYVRHSEYATLEAENEKLKKINANLMGDDEDAPRYTTKRLKQEIAKAVARTEASAAVKAGIINALKAIAEGYNVCGKNDRYVVVENPSYRPDNGLDRNICIDVSALSPAPQGAEAVGTLTEGDLKLLLSGQSVLANPMTTAPHREQVNLYTHPPAPAVTEAMVDAFIERYELGCSHRYDRNSIRAALQAAQEVKPC